MAYETEAFVTNQHGATHSVPRDQLGDHLARRMRPATDAEILAWFGEQGLDTPATALAAQAPASAKSKKSE